MLDWLEKHRWGIQIAGLGVTFVLALCFVFFRETLVQEGARIDSDDIVAMARGEVAILDDHYEAVGKVYSALGVLDYTWIIGLFAVCLMMGIMGYLHLRSKRVEWGTWGIEMIAIMLTGYYIGALSKDIFALLIVTLGSLLLLQLITNKFVVVGGMTGLMLALAWFIRPYWAVIAGGFLASFIILSLVRKRRGLVMVGLAVLLIAGGVIGYYILKGEDISIIRYTINTTTNLADTRLWGLMPSESIISGIVNSLAVFVGFFVPFQLFFSGSVFYVAAGMCFIVLFGYFGRWIWRTRREKLDYRVIAVCALFVAYFAVSSLFEPDYSSFLRHLTPMLPFMVFCLNFKALRAKW